MEFPPSLPDAPHLQLQAKVEEKIQRETSLLLKAWLELHQLVVVVDQLYLS